MADALDSLTAGVSEVAVASESSEASDVDEHVVPEPMVGYAMLKFGDAKYFMQTTSIMIGRDMHAYRTLQLQNEMDLSFLSYPTLYDPPGAPIPQNLADALAQLSAALPDDQTNYDTENDVIILPEANGTAEAPKPSSDAAQGEGGPISATDAIAAPTIELLPTEEVLSVMPEFGQNLLETEDLIIKSDERGTAECPFLAIHQPKQPNLGFLDGRNISRQHAKIEYNPEIEHFEIWMLGKNGGFVHKQFIPQGECYELR
jgi:hypothetical protein